MDANDRASQANRAGTEQRLDIMAVPVDYRFVAASRGRRAQTLHGRKTVNPGGTYSGRQEMRQEKLGKIW
jgi:hypothetical protein